MNKTEELKKLETEIKVLTKKLCRKVITYHKVCGIQLLNEPDLGIQLYGTAAFGIACNEDGSYRKVCSLTIKNDRKDYLDIVNETKFTRGDWNPNKGDINE